MSLSKLSSRYLSKIREKGKARTEETFEESLVQFEQFLQDPVRNGTGERLKPEDATPEICNRWLVDMRSEFKETTVNTRVYQIHRFYSTLSQTNIISTNPMKPVVEDSLKKTTPPDRRKISIPNMRLFLSTVQHPLHRTIFAIILKTGLNSAEISNLDCRDATLRGVKAQSEFKEVERPELASYTDALYIRDGINQGENVNGEIRADPTNRPYPTIHPIDDNLKQELQRWLAIRPKVESSTQPLFTSVSKQSGERVTPDQIHHIVTSYTAKVGWHEQGGGPEKNVTPLALRHFYTNKLRETHMDRGLIMYLRGDSFFDSLGWATEESHERYEDEWDTLVREPYEEYIYEI